MPGKTVEDTPSTDPPNGGICQESTSAFACPHLWQAANSASSLNRAPGLPNMSYATQRPDFVAGARVGFWPKAAPIRPPRMGPLTGEHLQQNQIGRAHV